MPKKLSVALLALGTVWSTHLIAQLSRSIPSFPTLGVVLYEKPKETPSVSIAQVGERTPAAAAGLAQGDFVLRMAERPITKIADVIAALDQVEPGASIEIVVRRGDQQRTMRVTPTPPDQLAASQ